MTEGSDRRDAPLGAALGLAAALFACRSREEVFARLTSPATQAQLGAESVAVFVVEGAPLRLRLVQRSEGDVADPSQALAGAPPPDATRWDADAGVALVPLRVGGLTVGALAIRFAPNSGVGGPDWLALFEGVGQVTSAALNSVREATERFALLRRVGEPIAEALPDPLERLREEFAVVVAHDLRDPIQAILVNVELLRRRRQGETLTASWSMIARIERDARRLGQITQDLLDASRIELRRVTLEREPVEVSAAVRALAAQLRDHPVHVEAAGPVTISADPERLDQIVTNLLDNAAKFSRPNTPITVRVAPRAGGVEIAVIDAGSGIAAEELPRLFDRFYQSRRARERKTGLGLGLYITRGLVEAHGGFIDVASTPGRGSTFTVWLPGP